MAIPEATIAISYLNPGTHFPLALRSVFAQTFQDWELILIDDGSTDGSAELASALRDPRVSAYSDGETRMSNVRGNELVRRAKGRFFFVMDADDVMHPERLRLQCEFLREAPANTVCGSDAFAIDGASKIVGLKPASRRQRHGFHARHSFINPTVAGHTVWFRRNPYSEDLVFHRSQDAELWIRSSAHSSFRYLDTPLMYYREAGCQSLDKMLRTELGVLCALRRHCNTPRARYLWLHAMESVKVGAKCVGYLFGFADRQVRSRYISLSAERLGEAQRALDHIMNFPLPL